MKKTFRHSLVLGLICGLCLVFAPVGAQDLKTDLAAFSERMQASDNLEVEIAIAMFSDVKAQKPNVEKPPTYKSKVMLSFMQ